MPHFKELRNSWPLVVALLVLVGGLAYNRMATDQAPPAIVLRSNDALVDGSPIRVHVAGAVARPGVYDLRQGDRVTEAIAAAGGTTAAADTGSLNLARRLRDEEQLMVPGAARSSSALQSPSPATGPININTATAAQLDALPGIGEAYSRRIVDSRAIDGPYESVEELVSRKVIPRSTFDTIRDLITVSDSGR